MAEKPYKIIDRRGLLTGSNKLVEASTQNNERKVLSLLNYDHHRNISTVGRNTLMTLGRWLYSNFGIIRGAIREMSVYSSEDFVPHFTGTDKAWGEQAALWMAQHDKVCFVNRGPWDMSLFMFMLVLGVLRDGDIGILLTENADGYPLFQVIPSHRIGPKNQSISDIASGSFKGYSYVDGVIIDDNGGPVGYRLANDTTTEYEDRAASGFMLSYLPEWSDQLRDYSAPAASAFDWQDIAETRRWERFAQKLSSMTALIEENDIGGPDPAKALLQSTSSDTSVTTAPNIFTEELDGGMIRYFRSNSGGGLKPFIMDRPTGAQQTFEDRLIRGAMHGLMWSTDFSLDPSKVGGAEMRIIIEKINRAIKWLRKHLIKPARARMDGYRLSKAMKLGLLPWSDDWWMWDYQGAAELTADSKYQSDTWVQEDRAGYTSPQRICRENGTDAMRVLDERIEYEMAIQTRCKAAGIDPNRIRMTQANAATTPNQTPGEKPAEKDSEK